MANDCELRSSIFPFIMLSSHCVSALKKDRKEKRAKVKWELSEGEAGVDLC